LKCSGVFNYKGHLIFFVHKILFPYVNNDEIVYIQGRNIEPDLKNISKELNLPKKIPCFYNVDCLKEAERVYIAERVIDTLTLTDKEYNSIGIVGINGLKNEWISLLKGKEVILALNNDKAGNEASEMISFKLRNKGITVKKMDLPYGEDVNSFFNNLLRQHT